MWPSLVASVAFTPYFGIWYNIGKVEHHSIGCPFCGSKVSLDTIFDMRGVAIIGSSLPFLKR